MPDGPRYLIGYGERLTSPITIASGGRAPMSPYQGELSFRRLETGFRQALAAAESLPAIACPNDEVVVALTLHPSFVAKSYFPSSLLRSAGMRPVGSRPLSLVPELRSTRRRINGREQVIVEEGSDERPTTEVFVAMRRTRLSQLARIVTTGDLGDEQIEQLGRIETVHLPGTSDKLRSSATDSVFDDRLAIEVVLHADNDPAHAYVLRGFENFLSESGIEVDLGRRLQLGGLCFLPALVQAHELVRLSEFSFTRLVRGVSRLRSIPFEESVTRGVRINIDMPDGGPVDDDLRVAVFDGGLRADSNLTEWASPYTFRGIKPALEEHLDHGQQVISSLLFGPINGPGTLRRPYSYVDVYQVLDEESEDNPYDLYDVLDRIDTVLSQSNYEFINLSIGPDLAIEDEIVHPWTAYFDQFLSGGDKFMSVAVGNNGDRDRLSGNARIQVPADCVNAVSVGAVTSLGPNWNRAPYSALGPGRRPGVIKPDLVAFGGCLQEPFYTLDTDGTLMWIHGTSFASPLVLRAALGIRALFGERLGPLALRALVTHAAEEHEVPDYATTGHGRLPVDLDDIVTCSDSEARVIYQGELTPGRYLRAMLPLPEMPMPGRVEIRATVAFATAVDPQDPGNYTQSGVEIHFRPDLTKIRPGAAQPQTRPFFSATQVYPNEVHRSDAHRWETILHRRRRFLGSTLNRSIFDLHYVAREDGHASSTTDKIRYAMVVSVIAPRVADLYERVLTAFATQLEPLTPVLELPLRS